MTLQRELHLEPFLFSAAEDSKKGSGAIWDEDEVKEPEAAIEEDPDDDRPTPE